MSLPAGSRLGPYEVNMAGGHGRSSDRYDKLRETAFDYASLLNQLHFGG